VEFLSNLNVKPSLHKRKLPIHDFLATVLISTKIFLDFRQTFTTCIIKKRNDCVSARVTSWRISKCDAVESISWFNFAEGQWVIKCK